MSAHMLTGATSSLSLSPPPKKQNKTKKRSHGITSLPPPVRDVWCALRVAAALAAR